jgi:lipoate-protein ligase A
MQASGSAILDPEPRSTTGAAVLLDSPPLDAAGQMALDETLLDGGEGDFFLRFYRWAARPAVTFGYFQKYEEVLKAVFNHFSFHSPFDNRHSQFSTVRRPTGGGIVFHEGDVTFSLVFRCDGTLRPQDIYRKVHKGVRNGLMEVMEAKTLLWDGTGAREEGQAARESGICFNRPEQLDLVWLNGRKVLGGALRRRNGRVLYQGSLQIPPSLIPSPLGRGEGEGDGRVPYIRPSATFSRGEKEQRDALEHGVVRGLEAEWGVALHKEDAPKSLLDAASCLRGKFASDGWNRKR